MVIANACGHPECQEAHSLAIAAHAQVQELAKELGQALAERDEARAKLSAYQARANDWHKVADSRSAEIIRLMDANEKLERQLSDARAVIAGLHDELAKGGRD